MGSYHVTGEGTHRDHEILRVHSRPNLELATLRTKKSAKVRSNFAPAALRTAGTEVDLTASDAAETRYAPSPGAQDGRPKSAARVSTIESLHSGGGDL